MTEQINKDNSSEGTVHSFPKSLRRIKSKWMGKDKKNADSEKDNSKTSLPHGSDIENNNCSFDEVSKETISVSTKTTKNNNFDFSNIRLENGNDFIKQISNSTEKVKKKNAFQTIKSYLEKNRSQQSIEEKKKIEPINCNESSDLLSNYPFTIFDSVYNENMLQENNSNHSKNLNSTLLDTSSKQTNINKPKNLIKIFKNNEEKTQSQEINQPVNNNLTSDVTNLSDYSNSDDIITMSINIVDKNNLNKDSNENKINSSPLPISTSNHQIKMVSLFVGDLDKLVSETDLYTFFSKFKGLISVKIPLDTIKNESLCYGYVNFDNQYHADIATEGLNYLYLKGSEIRIMPSVRDKIQRENMGANLFFSKLSLELSSRIMYDRLKIFGKILSCKYSKERGTCFVYFADKMQAYKICKQFNGTKMDDQTINVSVHISKKERDIYNNFQHKAHENHNSLKDDKIGSKLVINSGKNEIIRNNIKINEKVDKPKFKSDEKQISTQYSVFIRNMPLSLKKEVVKSLVEPYGTVKNVLTRDVPVKKGSWALVTLTNKDSVDRVIQNLNTVELEGKKLFVTRAIPREQKDYAKKEENYPKNKLKLLVNQINLKEDKELIENWCSAYNSITSAEFYSNPNSSIPNDSYGYIEMENESQADCLVKKLKTLNIICYKIKIEIPSKESNFETSRYPYIVHDENDGKDTVDLNKSSRKIIFSYINPNKMFQLASFQKMIYDDKANSNFKIENCNKTKFKEKWIVKDEMEQEILRGKRNEVFYAIWELCFNLFISKPSRWLNQQYFNGLTQANEILSKSKICSLTEHLIKFFWANNFEEFYKFLKQNQFDNKGRLLLVAHPVLANQLIQSATYLGIIPK